MNAYTIDFSYIDENNIIKRYKKYIQCALNVIEAALIIKSMFNVIRIREIKEIDSPISYKENSPIYDFNHSENFIKESNKLFI